MKSDTAGSMEPDRPIEGLETTNPAQPVIVVHDRRRTMLPWVLVLFSFVASICGILIYHRLVVGRDLGRAAEETQALLDSIDRDQNAARAQAAAQPPAPPALTSQPDRTGSTAPAVAPPSSSPAKPTPSAPSSSILGQSHAAPPASATAGSDPKPTQASIPTQPKLDSPALAGLPAAPVPKVKSDDQAANKQNVSVAPSPAPKKQESVPTRESKPADASNTVAMKEPARLPSREESVPAIPGKIKEKPVEINQQPENKQADTGALKYEERARFRDELKLALGLAGNQAGPEIDKLMQQYRYDGDADKLNLASRTWFFGRMPRQAKVRFIRSLGVPESVFLDFFAVDLERLIGARNGPRDKNDVRVRAAKLVLSYDLPAPAPVPGARSRPDQREAAAKPQASTASGTWAFVPERDRFRSDALLDLRGLNEKVAGQSGFVRLAPDGESFVLGDGTPSPLLGHHNLCSARPKPCGPGPAFAFSGQTWGQHGPIARPDRPQGQERATHRR